jgi:hypothetical protein
MAVSDYYTMLTVIDMLKTILGKLRLGDALIALILFVTWNLITQSASDPAPPNAILLVEHKDGARSEYSLSTDQEITVFGKAGSAWLTIENRRVSVTNSNCPRRLCQRTGAISRPGEIICCVPGQWWAIIAAAHEQRPDIDAISR